ncbi:MAG: aspartyl/asparaginyl beta-hydroxylase domain-containing protein [Bradyrhizobium sp.]|uniref:aspartyl/asparaginyl beta-hydroxylase domain-containing protein n=1 Tax=Bradyrhizobium sp. TaxID=376 RepID=UPI0011FF6A2D|nr:aspartyl/asparaginyl beta-hydroxylase domain-containing protein [Bradyrhizobium sp.]THD72519.1 MAG: aspartyl/asparaginyl beta-hydroxylase domain-containing protein [Bradyrhizobium sp.]
MNTTLRDRIGNWATRLGWRIVWSLDDFYARFSKLGDHEFFDNREFPWIPDIEADWRKVRAELDGLLPYTSDLPNFQDISREQRDLSQDDGWKTYFFYAFGLKAWGACRRCPETAKLLQRIPGMKTAFFSILAPGKRLPRHRGPYKGVLRLHLGLLIPEPAERCAIVVNSKLRHWQEGKALIFDDCFFHEAWNETDSFRVVLFVDLIRPMRFPANIVNAVMIWGIALSPFVLGSARGYFRWERRFEKIMNQRKPTR